MKTINGGKCNFVESAEYEKDYMKIKFNPDDNLPLNKILKLHNLTMKMVNSIHKSSWMNACMNYK